ncbi:MAG TPA: hypothetical protein DCY03_22155 [Planctomycetaceae bacterium]|nr:hypothetical protein [Planctomycetaceae bacterium]|tara:strand:+ start:2818 stop:3114 length:297 start_codon:yes stop_codon:yes gene_type:complete
MILHPETLLKSIRSNSRISGTNHQWSEKMARSRENDRRDGWSGCASITGFKGPIGIFTVIVRVIWNEAVSQKELEEPGVSVYNHQMQNMGKTEFEETG